MIHTTVSGKNIEGVVDLNEVAAIVKTDSLRSHFVYTIVFKNGAVLKGYETTGILTDFKELVNKNNKSVKSESRIIK